MDLVFLVFTVWFGIFRNRLWSLRSWQHWILFNLCHSHSLIVIVRHARRSALFCHYTK